ncbi:MAG: hypothetical protein ACOWWR_05275 [Eubacteriales bacterium]
MRRVVSMIFCFIVAILVLYIYTDMRFIPDSPLVDYYINNFKSDTWAENGVTAIYLNYRMFDSIFETLILMISVIAVIHFSWRKD